MLLTLPLTKKMVLIPIPTKKTMDTITATWNKGRRGWDGMGGSVGLYASVGSQTVHTACCGYYARHETLQLAQSASSEVGDSRSAGRGISNRRIPM